MKKYNTTFDELKTDGKDASSEENLVWKAYNLTLIENSKKFLHMIALNESIQNQDLNSDIKKIVDYFEEKKLNKTTVYHNFVDQFYSNFNTKVVKVKQSNLYKFYRKFLSNILRFKQSFSMVYLALKSILIGEDFIKLVNKELFNETNVIA